MNIERFKKQFKKKKYNGKKRINRKESGWEP